MLRLATLCATLALASPLAMADDCGGRGFMDIPDDQGTPLAFIDSDFEIQALSPISMIGPSGQGKTTTLRPAQRLSGAPIGDLTISKTMDVASPKLGCDVWVTTGGGVPVPSGAPIEFVSGGTFDATGTDEGGTIVVVDESGKVLSKGPAGKPQDAKPGVAYLIKLPIAQCLITRPEVILMDEPYAKVQVSYSTETCEN